MPKSNLRAKFIEYRFNGCRLAEIMHLMHYNMKTKVAAIVNKANSLKQLIMFDCLLLAQLHFLEQRKPALLSPSIHGCFQVL